MVLTMKNKSRTPLKRKGKATKLMDSKPELKSSQTEEPTRKVSHRTRTSHAESNITTAALRANPKKTKKALEMADSRPELKSSQKDEPTTKVLTKKAAKHMVEALKEDLKKRKHPDPNTAPPLYDTDTDSDITAVDLESTPVNQSPEISLIDAESEESFLQPPKKRAIISDEVVSALKELPDVVKTLKELVAAMKVPPASPALSCSTSSSDLQPIASAPVEVITLAGGLMIPKRTFDRLSKTKMSIFSQELAVVLFGRETLATSSLTGQKTSKNPLDPAKVNALIDTVLSQFPGTSPSDVRAVLRRKCNNESYSKRVQESDQGFQKTVANDKNQVMDRERRSE